MDCDRACSPVCRIGHITIVLAIAVKLTSNVSSWTPTPHISQNPVQHDVNVNPQAKASTGRP